MKFYRVHLRTRDDSSDGYEWTTSKSAAAKIKREHDAEHRRAIEELGLEEGVEVLPVEATVDGPHEIVPTRAGILAALNNFASHPNNG